MSNAFYPRKIPENSYPFGLCLHYRWIHWAWDLTLWCVKTSVRWCSKNVSEVKYHTECPTFLTSTCWEDPLNYLRECSPVYLYCAHDISTVSASDISRTFSNHDRTSVNSTSLSKQNKTDTCEFHLLALISSHSLIKEWIRFLYERQGQIFNKTF